MSPKHTDLRTRIGELEATVSGLTRELVDANERIRQLEAAVEEETPKLERREPGVRRDEEDDATRQMGTDDEAEEEPASDLDGIIVA